MNRVSNLPHPTVGLLLLTSEDLLSSPIFKFISLNTCKTSGTKVNRSNNRSVLLFNIGISISA